MMWSRSLEQSRVQMQSCRVATSPFHGLQIFRLQRIVFQSHAYLADRGIDSPLDIDKHIVARQGIVDLLAGHQLAWVLDEEHQQLQR